MKKLLSIILSFVFLIGILPLGTFTVNAEIYSGFCGENLTWSLDSDTGVLTISGSGDMYNYDIVEFGGAPWWDKDFKTVDIKNGVTSIGEFAFYKCKNFTSITIPDSVIKIGNNAFQACQKLKDVYYCGTKEEWNKISIGSENTCLTNATIHYAKDCSINGHSFINDECSNCKIHKNEVIFDLDLNCRVSTDDMILLKRAILFGNNDLSCDVNGDKSVDILDFIGIKKHLSGIA